MSKKKIRGLDASKIPWTPIICGATVIILLPKITAFIKSLNPFATDSEVAAAATSSWWSANYIKANEGKGYTSFQGFTGGSGEDKAEFIYKAYGAFTNDFSGIISVFKTLHYKTQVSELCRIFLEMYGQDLYTYITGGIKNASAASKDMQKIVIAYTNGLPSGFK